MATVRQNLRSEEHLCHQSTVLKLVTDFRNVFSFVTMCFVVSLLVYLMTFF